MPRHSRVTAQHKPILRANNGTVASQWGIVSLSVTSTILVARFLGPIGLGQWVTAIVTAGVLGLLTECGLRAAVVRIIASGKASWKEGLATMLAMYALLCIVTLPLASSLLTLFHHRLCPDIPMIVFSIALLGIPTGLLEGAFTSMLIGHHRMREVSAIWIMEKIGIISGLVILVWVLGCGVAGAVIAQLVGVTLGITVAMALLSHLPGGPLRIRLDLLGELFRYGAVWYGRNIASSLNYRIDALFVYYFLGGNAAGLYAVAVMLAELLQQLSISADSKLFPVMSHGEAIAIEVRTARLSRFAVAVTLLGGILLAVFGYFLIGLLFGYAYTGCFTALLLLLPGMLAMAQSKIIFTEMQGRGLVKYPMIASWVGFVVTISLDLLLIPRWGIAGAALASSVAYICSAAIGVKFYRDLTGIHPRTLYIPRYTELRDVTQRILH